MGCNASTEERKEITKLKAENAGLKEQVKEGANLKKDNTKLEAEIAGLKEQVKEGAKLEKEIARLRRQMSVLTSAKDDADWKKRVEEVEQRHDAAATMQNEAVLEGGEGKERRKKREESEMLGVSLYWVLNKMKNSAWEKVQFKGNKLKEKIGDNQYREFTVDSEKGVQQLNFYHLDPVLAHENTGIGYGKLCPRDGKQGCSIVDGLRDHGFSAKATVFLSWVWTYTLQQVWSALSNWHIKSNRDQRQEHHFIWWCFFCNNQYRLSDNEESSSNLAEVFGTKLRNVGRMLIVLDHVVEPKYIKRAWCVFEVWVAYMKDITDLDIALSDEGKQRIEGLISQGQFRFSECLTVESAKAKASKEKDQKYIMDLMAGKHAEVDTIVKQQLLRLIGNLARAGHVQTPIARIQMMSELLANGEKSAKEKCGGKDLTVMIGNTGGGKSTTMNFINGCTMERIKLNGEYRIQVSDHSEKKEVCKIGHGNQSETAMANVVRIDGQYFCDLPGFKDRHGSDISIANMLNFHYVLKEVKSVKFVVVLGYSSIIGDRGQAVDDVIQLLLALLASKEKIVEYQKAVLICITKVPKFNDADEVRTLEDVKCQFKTIDELQPLFPDADLCKTIQSIYQKSVIFHPLHQEDKPHASWSSRNDLMTEITGLAAITSPGKVCVLAPNVSEVVALRDLLRSAMKDVRNLCQELQYATAKANLAIMRSLVQRLIHMNLDSHMVEIHTEIEQELIKCESSCSTQAAASKGEIPAQAAASKGKISAQVLTASEDKTAKIWSTATGQCTQTLSGHQQPVRWAVLSADERSVLTASLDETAKIWSTATGQCTQTLSGHQGCVWGAVFSADERSVLTASDDKTAKIWSTATGQCTQTLSGHQKQVRWAVFSADERSVLTASEDKTAKIWSTATGQCTQTLSGHHKSVRRAVFSADERSVLTASFDRTAKIWSTATGQCTQTLSGHRDVVASAVFSADEGSVLTASFDNTVKIWSTATGQCTQTLSGHQDSVRSAVFSADERSVLTASDDGTAKIWSTATGQCTQTLSGHEDTVNAAMFFAN